MNRRLEDFKSQGHRGDRIVNHTGRFQMEQQSDKAGFGVVVLSHAFFAKNWPQYELDGLVTREMTGKQVILPLWHGITKSEVISYSPSLADKVARSTADFTIDEMAQEIADVIKQSR